MTAWRKVLSTEYSVPSPEYGRLAIFVAIAALSFFGPGLSRAVDSSGPDPIKAGKDALTSGNRFPWYDRRQDDVRRLNVVPRQTTDERGTQWTAAPSNAP